MTAHHPHTCLTRPSGAHPGRRCGARSSAVGPRALGLRSAGAAAALLLVWGSATGGAAAPTLGQQTGQGGGLPDILHTVQPGDTLEGLTTHYLGMPQAWPRLQQLNRVAEPRHLQPGTTLRIPRSWLAHGQAEVSFVHGPAQVTLPGQTQPQTLQSGQALPEGAQVQVPADSFVSVRLQDGSIIRVQASSELRLQQLRRRGRAGDAQSVLELQRGSLETSVPPQPGSQRQLEIRTPLASTSVRGTRFSVAVDEAGQRSLTTVTQGQVQIRSAQHQSQQPVPDIRLALGQGIAVTAQGGASVHPLLPAPDLSQLPVQLEDVNFFALDLPQVPGAQAYQVQVARDADFTQVLRSAHTPDARVRLPALDDGTYHLALRALDAHDLPGLMAQRTITIKAHPVAPLYHSPTSGATVPRQQGRLHCTPVAGIARYRIQAAASADFAAPLLDTDSSDCSVQVASLAPGQYFWRVASVRTQADGQPDQGPFAPAQRFAVAEQPAAPDTRDIHSHHDHVHWPGEAGQRWRLQLARSNHFDAPVLDTELTQPLWSAPRSLPPGSYYLRLQTHDPSGLSSPFSPGYHWQVPAAVSTGSGGMVTSGDGQPLAHP